MEQRYHYEETYFRHTLPLEQYVAEYRDVERIHGYCKACNRYRQNWGCPPFDYDIEARIAPYKWATIVVAKMSFKEEERPPLSVYFDVIKPVRLKLEQTLRSMEHEVEGLSFGFAGSCHYCPQGTCTRPLGLACRHPQLVRPSLEAYGFDLSKTAEQLFELPMLWSNDHRMPLYTLLVTGLFHNHPLPPLSDTLSPMFG